MEWEGNWGKMSHTSPTEGGYMTCAPLMGSPVEGVHQRWREPEDAWLGGSSGEPSQGADVS